MPRNPISAHFRFSTITKALGCLVILTFVIGAATLVTSKRGTRRQEPQSTNALNGTPDFNHLSGDLAAAREDRWSWKTATDRPVIDEILYSGRGSSERESDERERYMPVPGGESDDLDRLEAEWHNRLTYPTGVFDPAWLRQALLQDKLIADAIPAGLPLNLAAQSDQQSAAASSINTNSFTALGPKPLRMTGCSGCYNYSITSGRVNDIAIDPVTSNVAYVATVGGGVWKTTNCCSSATTWSATTDDPLLATISIDTVTIDPNDHNTVYAGTGDLNYGSFSMGSQGILKSTDAGATWTLLGADVFGAALPLPVGQFPQYQAVGKVRVDPRNSHNVVAGTKTGLYFSYDAGQNWTGPCTTNNYGTMRQDITGLALSDVGGVTRIIAAVGVRGFSTTVQYNLNQNGANGIYRATMPAAGCPGDFAPITRNDNGWTNLNATSGVAYSSPTAGNQAGRIDIAVAPSNPNYIYAQVQSIKPNSNGGCGSANGCQLGAFRTTDGGETWTQIPGSPGDALRNCGNAAGDYPQNWYDQGIAVDPNNPDRVFFDTFEVWFWQNGNASWNDTTCGYSGSVQVVHVDQHALAFVPGSSSILLAGNDGGVHATTNANVASQTGRPTWFNMGTGLNTIEFYSGDISANFATSATPQANGGAQDNGSASVTFNGYPTGPAQWQMGKGGDGFYGRIDPVGGRFWQGNNGGHLSVCLSNCTASGATWTDVEGPWSPPAVVAPETQSFILPYEIFKGNPGDPANDCPASGCNHLIVGTYRVWETVSNGAGWYPASMNLTKQTLGNRSFINQLAFEPKDQSHAIVGTNDGNVQIGAGLGAGAIGLWTDVTGANTVLPNRPILDVTFDPTTTTSPIAYAAVGGFNANTPATPGHVFQLTCGLECTTFTWANKTGNLPDIPVDSIVANPNYPKQVFAGTDWGLYFTDDITAASPVWYRFQNGLPHSMVWDMQIDRGATTLSVWTRGRGAYVWPLPSAPINNPSPTPTPTPSPTPTPTPNCSSPHTGSVSPSANSINYCGGPFAAPNPSAPLGNTPPVCAAGTCDQFALNVSIPSGDHNLYAATVSIGWEQGNGDFDLYVYQPDSTGTMVSKGDGSTNPEVARFYVTSGNYTVYVVPFDNGSNVTFNGSIRLTPLFDSGPVPTATPAPRVIPAAIPDNGAKVGFENFTAPGVLSTTLITSAGQQPNSVEYLGRNAGEPSIGNNWKTGVTAFQSDLQTLFVTFDDTCPANGQTSTWVNRQATTSQAVNSDPIGFTDPQTGRTFAGELTLLSPSCKTSYTDDDGKTWIPTQGSGIASAVDHQTIGGGPFAAPLTRPTNVPGVYPNAVYYCSQEGQDDTGFCSRSDDGGLTFGPSVPVSTPLVSQCSGLHGHVKVSPKDGTVYLPVNYCDGVGSVIVSRDNGVTWTARQVQIGNLKTQPSVSFQDPAVTVDANGRVYFIIANNDTQAAVFTSDDFGASWQNAADVSAAYGLNNIRYPAAIAGDAGRASVAFYGTTTPGDALLPTFDGEWHLYIANTFDGGRTWTTTDATPNAPLQRGCIWAKGGANICRNLLDFFDMTVDREGRVLVGYVNGCEGGNCAQAAATAKGNAYTAAATIARQSSGRRLIAAYDPLSNVTRPGVPSLTARRVGNVVHLGWSEADTGNSPITSYKIMRGIASGGETLLATVSGDQTRYDDISATDTSKTYYYKVLAVNVAGTSCGANEVVAPYLGETCSGVIIHRNEPAHPEANLGLNTPASLLIDYIAVGEPPASDNLMFKMKVNSLASLPANSRWRMAWNSFSAEAFDSVAQQYYVGMTTGPDGIPTFEWGTLADAGLPAVYAISETRRGDALPASNYTSDGLITIYIPKSVVGSPQPGDLLGAVNGRTFTADMPGTAESKLERSNLFVDHTFVKAQTDNSYPASTYMIAGNTDCSPYVQGLINSLVTLQASNAGTSSGISSFNLTMTNTSSQTIFTPIRVEVVQLTSASGKVRANNADGGGTGIGAFWDYDTKVGADNLLSPNETSGPRLLKFSNPSSEPFTVTFNIIGTLQRSSSSSSSSGSSGGSSGSGSYGAGTSPAATATNAVFSLTYNPLLNTIKWQILKQ